MGLKLPRGNREAHSPKALKKVMVKPFRFGWRRGLRKGGPISFLAIAVKGELRDNEYLALDIDQRTVHLSLRVCKDAESCDFIGQVMRLVLIVLSADP